MTKRRREVLAHIAGDYGTPFRLYRVTIPGQQWRAGYGLVDKWTLAGVDVTAIVKALARERLIRHRYGFNLLAPRCLCITVKGIEELLWPTM